MSSRGGDVMAGATEWLVRHRTSGWAVSGLLLLLGALTLLALPYPHSLSTARGYQETSGSVVIPAVVRDLRNMSNGRGGEYWVEVRGPASVSVSVSVSGRIELDDPDPVLSRLSRGDRVGILLWHGRRTGITFDGRVQEAVTAPPLVPARAGTRVSGGAAGRRCGGRTPRRAAEPDHRPATGPGGHVPCS
ncbi:hypothetical protein [Streptomyces sp. NPDC001635]